MIFRVLWNQFGGLGKGCESERVRLIELDFGPNTLGTKQSWKNPKQIEQSYQIIFRLWARKSKKLSPFETCNFHFLQNSRMVNRYRTVWPFEFSRTDFLSKNEKRCRKRRGAKCPRRDTQSRGELFSQSRFG